jgi:pyridoxamine 5'-phosphate oxidase
MPTQKNPNLADLRQDYQRNSLEINEIASNPIEQFEKWFAEAVVTPNLIEPNAMTISTVTKSGFPSSRIVLLKGLDAQGFVFFTNYESRKGTELIKNPHAALNFWWPPLERQVRIEGHVEKLSTETSLIYFQSRPKSSQIGAWASPQSQVIDNRELLEKNVESLEKQYENAENLPIPPFWGGFRVIPTRVEFWQGRSSRLHDRLVYSKKKSGDWLVERLAP